MVKLTLASSGISNKMKHIEWQKVTEAVNAVSSEPWTLEMKKSGLLGCTAIVCELREEERKAAH